MSHNVTLGLRRGTHTSEPAVGYLTGWGWDENEVNCAEPVWLKKRLAWGTDARPDQNEHTPIGSSSQAAGATTKNTEKLLAQLAVGVRWIGWALAALAAAIIYHDR